MEEDRNVPEESHEVLRAKRLEIVDEEGTVRAELGPRENDIGGLRLFDAKGRKRCALEAGEIEGEGSGLSIFDIEGKVRAVVYVHNDPRRGTAVYLADENEKGQVSLGLYEDGQATLSISAKEKDRAIKLSALSDDSVVMMLGGEGAPTAGLSLSEEEGTEPSANLGLMDKDGRAGVVVSGRKYKPYMRFVDYRGEVRTGLELADNGELEMTSFGERRGLAGSLERLLGEASIFYRAFVAVAFLVVSALIGGWIAATASEAAGGVRRRFILLIHHRSSDRHSRGVDSSYGVPVQSAQVTARTAFIQLSSVQPRRRRSSRRTCPTRPWRL